MKARFTAKDDNRGRDFRRVYAVAGYWADNKVRVEQRVNMLTGRYEAPEVSHSLGGEDSTTDNLSAVENFVAALTDAVRVAREWQKRTGKKPAPEAETPAG